MAIHQTGKKSDLEKRLRLLRTQVYGKTSDKSEIVKIADSTRGSNNSAHAFTDLIFLRKDLLKISVLSGLAIGTQLLLFYLSKRNILNLNLF